MTSPNSEQTQDALSTALAASRVNHAETRRRDRDDDTTIAAAVAAARAGDSAGAR